MNPQIVELREILGEELSIYQKLFQYAGDKRKLLLEKFSTDLQTIVTQEEILVQRLIELEPRRRECVCAIAGTPDANLDTAVEKIPEADSKSDIWMIGSQLRDVVNDIKTVNEENQRLIEQALELTQYSVKLITRAPADVTYGPAGKKPGQRVGPAIIDRKA
ncbi:MAG: flagellar protein FlgN [Candidatus Riflebacteria bacterium]|nr:flagellar protein FlgN [Candidatus Riflebacteria bacterium]